MEVRDVGNTVSAHWDDVYGRRGVESVSWFEADPLRSLEWVRAAAPSTGSAVVDVGAGASLLIDRLVAAGYTDLTVLDVSAAALDVVRSRLGARAAAVHFVVGDLLQWAPARRFDLWHDRAVFHFLVDAGDRARYVAVLRAALRAGGHVVMATFGPSGPEQCSGLPTARYDADGLAAAVGEGFTVVRAEAAVHRTPDGVTQEFTWVTLRRNG